MQHTRIARFLFCFMFLTACASMPAQPTAIAPGATAAPVAASPQAAATGVPTQPAADILTQGESLLSYIPNCTGLNVLDSPVIFSWPNLDQIVDSSWGYYSCNQSQADVAAFYRKQLPKEPYDDMEINWVEKDNGTVGVYYVTADIYLYIWMLPQPDDPQASYVIVALDSKIIEC
jgi:hypothetical protein